MKSGKATHSLQALAGSLIASEDETEGRSEHASPELKYPPTEEAPLASGQETPKVILMSQLPSGIKKKCILNLRDEKKKLKASHFLSNKANNLGYR